jgi:hypothetical protein
MDKAVIRAVLKKGGDSTALHRYAWDRVIKCTRNLVLERVYDGKFTNLVETAKRYNFLPLQNAIATLFCETCGIVELVALREAGAPADTLDALIFHSLEKLCLIMINKLVDLHVRSDAHLIAAAALYAFDVPGKITGMIAEDKFETIDMILFYLSFLVSDDASGNLVEFANPAFDSLILSAFDVLKFHFFPDIANLGFAKKLVNMQLLDCFEGLASKCDAEPCFINKFLSVGSQISSRRPASSPSRSAADDTVADNVMNGGDGLFASRPLLIEKIIDGMSAGGLRSAEPLIFDLGGGAFDLSLLSSESGISDVKAAVAGDTPDEDLDNREVRYFSCIYKRMSGDQRTLVEPTPSSPTRAHVEIDPFFGGEEHYSTSTRARIEDMNMDYFRTCLEPVDNALKDNEVFFFGARVDGVLLVRGSSRIPKVHQLLQDYFRSKELSKSVNLDDAMVFGAMAQTANRGGHFESEKLPELSLFDVTPLSLGPETAGEELAQEDVHVTVLKSNGGGGVLHCDDVVDDGGGIFAPALMMEGVIDGVSAGSLLGSTEPLLVQLAPDSDAAINRKDENVLIFDLGGGAFDLSLLTIELGGGGSESVAICVAQELSRSVRMMVELARTALKGGSELAINNQTAQCTVHKMNASLDESAPLSEANHDKVKKSIPPVPVMYVNFDHTYFYLPSTFVQETNNFGNKEVDVDAPIKLQSLTNFNKVGSFLVAGNNVAPTQAFRIRRFCN